MPVNEEQIAINAYFKLRNIVSVIVGAWQPNWENDNEYKYYPYFRMASGFGFSSIDWSYSHSSAYVGSRLCFQSRDKAKHFFDHFQELFESYMLIAK